MKRSFGIFATVILIVALLVAGCTTTSPAPSGSTSPAMNGIATSGKVTISGAFALYPMMQKWAEEYNKIHPNVKIEISAGGAGKGMTDALTGMVDLGMVSREISTDEEKQGAVYVAVTKDAVVPTISSKNPVLSDLQTKGVKQSVFKKIFVNESVKTWGEVAGRPEISDKISLYTRSDACGAADVWAKYLGGKQENLKGIGIYGDPGLADAVKSDSLGIGYNNIGFAFDATSGKPIDGLAIVPLDQNGNGTIDPEEQVYGTREEIVRAINTGHYPSPPARELNIVTKEKFTGPTKEFVRWILTDGQQYVEETGYIALSKDTMDEQLAKLD